MDEMSYFIPRSTLKRSIDKFMTLNRMQDDPMRIVLALDVETTGLDPRAHNIISISLALVGYPTGTMWSKHWLVRPTNVKITPEITEITGITQEMVSTQGEPIKQVMNNVLLIIDGMGIRVPLVIYNAPFDAQFVKSECERAFGVDINPLGSMPIIDPLVIDRQMDKYRPGSRRLGDVAKIMGISPDSVMISNSQWAAELFTRQEINVLTAGSPGGLHSSDVDAALAGHIALKMTMQRYPSIVGMTADELHQAQIGWAREQQLSLRQYWRRRGDARWSNVTIGWPYKDDR